MLAEKGEIVGKRVAHLRSQSFIAVAHTRDPLFRAAARCNLVKNQAVGIHEATDRPKSVGSVRLSDSQILAAAVVACIRAVSFGRDTRDLQTPINPDPPRYGLACLVYPTPRGLRQSLGRVGLEWLPWSDKAVASVSFSCEPGPKAPTPLTFGALSAPRILTYKSSRVIWQGRFIILGD